MSWPAGGGSHACILLLTVCVAAHGAPAAGARTQVLGLEAHVDGKLHRVADTGIDIVRMPPSRLPPPSPAPAPTVARPATPAPPPSPPASPPSPPPAAPPPAASPPPPPSQIATPAPSPPPPAPPPPSARPAEPQARAVKVTAKLSGLPYDTQRSSLGGRLEPLDANLASALRVPNPNAALVVEAPPGGAGGPARVQFGDIIAGLNGAAVTGANELRQRFASIGPGRDVELEVWRIGAGDGFLPALRRLAADGNAAAMYRLGRLYATASGVERDEVEAVRWYQKGADGGDQNAITALAVAKLEGRGTARDDPEGVRLLRRAADEGNTEAVYRYAVAMVEGRIVGKDTAEALRQLNKCAEAGFTPAMLELAQLYNTGEGVPLDAAKTAAWYRQAADLGNPIGMVNLGFMYHQGKGVERNDITAVAWYRKAASEGNSLGVHNLAAMLDKGQGVARKDPDQAADLVLHALELRNEFTLRQMTNNSRAWSAEFRRALQKKLQQAGFFTGKIDGELRSTTVEALKAYINRKR